MYVVKVGEYYVKSVESAFGGFIGNITLSKEVQGHYTLAGANRLARMLDGKVIEITDVVTND